MNTVKAFYTSESINLRECKQAIAGEVLGITSTDIFFKMGEGRYCLVFNYGVLVFYNCSEAEIIKIFHDIHLPFSKGDYANFYDEFNVHLEEETYSINFAHIILPEINESVIRIVMLNLGQSLALKYYDHVSQELLSSVRIFTNQLESIGSFKLKGKSIMKFVGKALNTQNKIAENLYIFDSPPDTWHDEYLEKVNVSLNRHFELSPRYRSIDSTFKIIQANLAAFMELSHHKESSKLEWIIIILILIEIMDTWLSKIL